MSIVFLFDENPDVARPARAASGRRRAKCADPAARVGNRFSAPQIVWNKSNRYKGAWWGAGGQAQMGEDFDNHRRIFDGGPSTGLTTGDDF